MPDIAYCNINGNMIKTAAIDIKNTNYNDAQHIKTKYFCNCDAEVSYVKNTIIHKFGKKFPKCAFFRHKNNNQETYNCVIKEDEDKDVDIFEYYINFFKEQYINISSNEKIYNIQNDNLLIKLDNNLPSNIVKLQQDFEKIILIINGKLKTKNNKFLTIKLYDLKFFEGHLYIHLEKSYYKNYDDNKTTILIDYDGTYYIKVYVNDICPEKVIDLYGFRCEFIKILDFWSDYTNYLNDGYINYFDNRKDIDIKFIDEKINSSTLNFKTINRLNLLSRFESYNENGKIQRIQLQNINWYNLYINIKIDLISNVVSKIKKYFRIVDEYTTNLSKYNIKNTFISGYEYVNYKQKVYNKVIKTHESIHIEELLNEDFRPFNRRLYNILNEHNFIKNLQINEISLTRLNKIYINLLSILEIYNFGCDDDNNNIIPFKLLISIFKDYREFYNEKMVNKLYEYYEIILNSNIFDEDYKNDVILKRNHFMEKDYYTIFSQKDYRDLFMYQIQDRKYILLINNLI